ncbi:hypothetical protein TIFTF001_044223 [Ficus carica]|uniref:Uncharacterized protein n=1 Tax=Ficus carica TaxID=3494 RepID=A0AA87ZBA5_FICCA|nr:hypothetical protein TIFTF001_044223 [Ficus carica]
MIKTEDEIKSILKEPPRLLDNPFSYRFMSTKINTSTNLTKGEATDELKISTSFVKTVHNFPRGSAIAFERQEMIAWLSPSKMQQLSFSFLAKRMANRAAEASARRGRGASHHMVHHQIQESPI